MRIFIDAMCAEYGGIRTYVEQLLLRWHEQYPDDDVHVGLRAGSTIATPGLTRHEYAVGKPDALARPWAQTTRMHRDIRALNPDVILATAPTTDPRRSQAPLAVVILDLRSELRPEQFSRGRRALRWASYGRSYALAAGFISISQRSLDDLHRLHPRTTTRPGYVAYLGADHVAPWRDHGLGERAVAFAHHTNKNPELVVRGWRALLDRGVKLPITLLGVSRGLRPVLEQLITELDLGAHVELAPFLPDADFQATLAAARMIVFPSDFEGFGLPIVEGMALGKPVVIGLDPGCAEVAGGHAFELDAWTPTALADQVERALAADADHLKAAQAWADTFTWQRTVTTTRAALAELVGRS